MPTQFLWSLAAALMLFAISPANSAFAAGADTDYARSDALDPIRKIIAEGDYVQAIEELEAENKKDPDNPDVLNLLGYSHRKQGNVDEAFRYYDAALQLDPQHRGANEYLGELYLETDQLDEAEKRLAVLDKECFLPCDEYSMLKAAIATYREKNGVK